MIRMRHYGTQSVAEFGRFLVNEYGEGLWSFEEAAQRAAKAIYDEFRDSEGHRAFSLVRVFRLCHYTDLAPDLAELVTNDSGHFLALVATIGEMLEWNDRRLSRHHRVISPAQAGPMFCAAFAQLGLTWAALPEHDVLEFEELAWSTRSFFVPAAQGSPLIPDQAAFVRPFDIRSVIGLGGVFADGSNALLVAFSNVPLDDYFERHFSQLTPFLMTLLSRYNDRFVLWRAGAEVRFAA